MLSAELKSTPALDGLEGVLLKSNDSMFIITRQHYLQSEGWADRDTITRLTTIDSIVFAQLDSRMFMNSESLNK